MELETIGTIERIRNDRKALTLGFNTWYQFFKPIPEEFDKGDYVKIVFIQKLTDDKQFNNVKSMVKIKRDQPLITKEIEKECDPEIRFLSIQTQNTILLCVKDIIVASINEGKTYQNEELSYIIKKLTDDFKKAYETL